MKKFTLICGRRRETREIARVDDFNDDFAKEIKEDERFLKKIIACRGKPEKMLQEFKKIYAEGSVIRNPRTGEIDTEATIRKFERHLEEQKKIASRYRALDENAKDFAAWRNHRKDAYDLSASHDIIVRAGKLEMKKISSQMRGARMTINDLSSRLEKLKKETAHLGGGSLFGEISEEVKKEILSLEQAIKEVLPFAH